MSAERRREKQTLIPAFDPEELARELEQAGDRPTITPPFDPNSYARIVDAHVSDAASARDTPRTITAVVAADDELAAQGTSESAETIGRAMYGSYLESDFPEALVLAERVLAQQPDHALAQLVAERCRARLSPSETRRLKPSSVLRLREPTDSIPPLDATSELVVRHVDGVSDAATVASLSGLPEAKTLDRLHALLDLGVLEVVSA